MTESKELLPKKRMTLRRWLYEHSPQAEALLRKFDAECEEITRIAELEQQVDNLQTALDAMDTSYDIRCTENTKLDEQLRKAEEAFESIIRECMYWKKLRKNNLVWDVDAPESVKECHRIAEQALTQRNEEN